MKVLKASLGAGHSIEDYHLVAIGNCLRHPNDALRFVRATVDNVQGHQLPERNEWLKALARMLQYREDAAQELHSEDCRVLSKYCLGRQISRVALPTFCKQSMA